jgi:hypothetical protein
MPGIYPDYQLQWQDRAGSHLFVSSYANVLNAATTLALSLQANNSALAIKITEVGNMVGECKGIYYKPVYEWGTWQD